MFVIIICNIYSLVTIDNVLSVYKSVELKLSLSAETNTIRRLIREENDLQTANERKIIQTKRQKYMKERKKGKKV